MFLNKSDEKKCNDIAKLRQAGKKQEYIASGDAFQHQKQEEVNAKRLELANARTAMRHSVRDQQQCIRFFNGHEQCSDKVFGVRQLMISDLGLQLRHQLPTSWPRSKNFHRNTNYFHLMQEYTKNPDKLIADEKRFFGKNVSFDHVFQSGDVSIICYIIHEFD